MVRVRQESRLDKCVEYRKVLGSPSEISMEIDS